MGFRLDAPIASALGRRAVTTATAQPSTHNGCTATFVYKGLTVQSGIIAKTNLAGQAGEYGKLEPAVSLRLTLKHVSVPACAS